MTEKSAPGSLDRRKSSAPDEPVPVGIKGTEKSYADLMQASYAARESASAIARWIMASLLAVNGGAEAAVLSALEKAPNVARGAGPWFVIGLVTAIAGGMCAWISLRSIVGDIEERVDHIRGLVCADETKDARALTAWAKWSGLMVGICFCASLMSFIAGAVGAIP